MQKNVYYNLFKTTFVLSAFTFGGGYVIIPLMKQKFVEELQWINEKEMMDLISIAQSSPGSLAVNASILVGYRMKGIKGSLLTVLATITPPLFIISFVSAFYDIFTSNPLIIKVLAGMNVGIAAILIDVAYTLGYSVIKDFKFYSVFIILGTIIASFMEVNIMIIVFTGGLLGLLYFSFIFRKKLFREKDKNRGEVV
ncbi:MAG: chromate transporter [Erysipelothrix sp.]|nr:chromate transporter [Erysipelothrix sp.]